MTTASDYDDQVLTTRGFGSTLITDEALQTHLCQTWYIGLAWNRWDMIAHAIASIHDLYYATGDTAGIEDLLSDLEFLRQVAITHRSMAPDEYEPEMSVTLKSVVA